MRSRPQLLLQLLLVLAAGAAAASASLTAAASRSPPPTSELESFEEHSVYDETGLLCDSSEMQRGAILDRALAVLQQQFDVERGNLSFHPGGNPQGRYGVCTFSEKLLPPGLKQAAKITAGFPIPINASFVLGPQDAVFWLGCTPPPTRYFSIRSYLAYRFVPAGEDEPFYNVTGLMPAAELGDPTNHAVIKTTGGPGQPFGKTTLFVSTADEGTDRRIREAFRAAGFPETAMNLDVLPAEKLSFRHAHYPWVLDRADTIAWQFRVNEFINAADAPPYLGKTWPIYLLQAQTGPQAPEPQPLQAPARRARGTGQSEEWLRSPLEQLKAAVAVRFAARGLRLADVFPLAPNVPDPDRCMTDLTDYCPVAHPIPEWGRFDCLPSCDWFTNDALYSMPADDAPYQDFVIPQNRSLVIVGVNHPLINKASFLNFLVTGINNPERPGHTPNFSSTHLAGSGQYYLPEVAEAGVLFAQELARDCGDRLFCETVTRESIDYDEYIYFAERAYLEPTTMIGPSPDEIIPPVVLAFDPVDEPKRVVPEEAAAAAAVKSSASSAGRLRGPSSREEVKLREGR